VTGAQGQICVNLRPSAVEPFRGFFAFVCGCPAFPFASLREFFLFWFDRGRGLAYGSIHVPRFFPRLLDGRQNPTRLAMKLVSLSVFHRFESASDGNVRR
jgi:hypothetical protein